MYLLEQGHYDPQKKIHRSIIAYVYIPVLQRNVFICHNLEQLLF